MSGVRDIAFSTSGLHGKMNLAAPGPYWLIIIRHVHFPNAANIHHSRTMEIMILLMRWLIWGQTHEMQKHWIYCT